MFFDRSSLPGVQDTFITYTVYDDALTFRLLQEVCSILGKISNIYYLFYLSLLSPHKSPRVWSSVSLDYTVK